jgi:L-ascorbate metabolism protein UlaG (beta-lactamase superfamily)
MSRAATLVAALWMAGCLLATGPGVSGIVETAGPQTEPLRVVYLGTGGWILQHGDATVITGPLFTNPRLITTGLLPIRSDTAIVDRHMSRYDVSSALAILVGHAHYDHLMDVPRVAARHAPAARIVGSRTVANTLGTWSGLAERVDVIDEHAGDQVSPGRWLSYGERVRVLPLRSHHAPHWDGETLYHGERVVPLQEEPAWATDWLDGDTYAFLIDFLANPDSVAFRVYYQDAVAAPPAGFAPDELIGQRAVDVALIVPSTFDQVDWHPEALIENLRPRRVVLGHWEDFFTPMEDPTLSLRITDLRHFERRLDRVFDGEWWRPDRFTELLLR